MAAWTTPLTAEVTAGAGAPTAGPGTVEAGAGVLAGGALGAGTLGAEAAGAGVPADGAEAPVPLTAACPADGTAAAVAGAGETVEDTVEDAADATVDAAEEGAAGSGGSCAADAGRAKITARIMASTKIAARPPQAHTQARRDQAPASLDNPTLWRMGTFPSTARKPRQTLRCRAINLTK